MGDRLSKTHSTPNRSARQIDAVLHDLDLIANRTSEVGNAYRWLYATGYERAARGKQEGGGGGGKDDGAGGVYAQRAAVRRKLEEASQHVEASRIALSAAMAALNDIAHIVDMTDHLPGEHDRAIPRTATSAELEQARRAALRRAGRGEGYGDS